MTALIDGPEATSQGKKESVIVASGYNQWESL